MVAVNLNIESQAEIGKKGKASNTASDLFTQLLNNALEKQKQPRVLDPKQAMQNAQKGDFSALTQEVLKSISKKSEPQNTTQDSQKLNNANKAYNKAQGIKEQPQPVVLREDSAPVLKKEQAESDKAIAQTADKKEQAESKANAEKDALKDAKESKENKEQKTAKTEKEDKQESRDKTKLKHEDAAETTRDLKQKLASKDEKGKAKDSKDSQEKIATKEEKGESAQNNAKEKLTETKQEMQKTNDELLTSMLRNSKQMLKDSKEIAEKNKKLDAKESKDSKESEKPDTIEESKNAKETTKSRTKDSKITNDSKEKIDDKQSTEDSKILRETREKVIQTTTTKVMTQTAEANVKITLANLLNFRTSTRQELKEDLQNTIAEQKDKLANTNPQDSLHISNRLAKIIEKLLVRYQSDDPNAIAGAFKHGLQLASLSTEDSKALAQISAELSQKGINLREILLQALEELQTEKQPKIVQAEIKESMPTNNANAQKIMTQLMQDIKDNLRDTILGFIGKDNKEMPQTILGMSKGVSNTEFATDIKDIVQKLETMLRDTLRLEESETKAIGKEILIQNLLKDSNTTKIAFDKKDLILMRAQSLIQAPQNPNTQSKDIVQNEILNKILSGSTISLSLLKELAGSFANYQEQEQWLQKFAEFANLNLKNFQYSSINSTPIFSELGAKNPLLSALLQGNIELQKTLFDYAKEAQGGKAPNLAAPIPSRFVPNTAPAPVMPDVKHPLTAKLAELNAKTAAMVGAKPDFSPNDAGKISLEELIARERLAIQKAVEQTKTQTTTQQPIAAESSIAKTLQAFKEEIYKEVFNRKNDEQSEEETILSREANKTTKTADKKTSTKTSSVAQNNAQSSVNNDDKYRQNNASNERPNPTHSNHNQTSETLKWEQNEYDKQQANQQEAQKLHRENATLLTPENKKQAASASVGKTSILDVLSAKITQSTKAKEATPQAVVIDSKAEIAYRSAAARETLRNFTGSLREGIQTYKPPLSKLSIELSPEHLGNVEVTLKQRGTQLIVQIHSNPQALQLFMANAQDFKQQLFGIGYENIEMTFQDADGNTYSDGGGQGGGNGGERGGQQQHEEQPHEESTAEELQMRQEMAQEIGINSRTWNTFGLQAYKNSDSVMQKLRFLELTLTPKYA